MNLAYITLKSMLVIHHLKNRTVCIISLF